MDEMTSCLTSDFGLNFCRRLDDHDTFVLHLRRLCKNDTAPCAIAPWFIFCTPPMMCVCECFINKKTPLINGASNHGTSKAPPAAAAIPE